MHTFKFQASDNRYVSEGILTPKPTSKSNSNPAFVSFFNNMNAVGYD